MEDTANEQDVKYDLVSIVNEIETATEETAVLDSKLGTDYLIGNVDTDTLLNLGFEYVGKTNKCGFETPLFKLGNIEAIYIEQRLCVYSVS